MADAPEPDTGPVVAYVGSGVPLELLDAAGIRAVRVRGDHTAPTPRADEVAEAAIDPLARAQLDRLLAGSYANAAEVWIAHDTEGSARVFHYAAECRHRGAPVGGLVAVDLVAGATPAHHTQRMAALARLRERVERLAGRTITDADLAAALVRADERRHALDRLMALRGPDQRRLSGRLALEAVALAAATTPAEHTLALRERVADASSRLSLDGRPVVLTGSAHDDPTLTAMLEARGLLVVGEDHDWGPAWFDHEVGDHAPGADPWAALASRYGPGAAPRTGRTSIAARVAHTTRLAVERGAELVVAVLRRGDNGPPWDVPAQRGALAEHGIPLLAVTVEGCRAEHLEPAVEQIVRAIPAAGPTPTPATPIRPARADRQDAQPRQEETPPRPPRPRGLEASRIATAHQREWFAELRDRVAAGTPLAVVNADAPHEVLRAMGIPYVVNQWWASVCAASQQGPRYLAHLRDLGYPDDVEAYSAMALGSALDPDTTDAPWGGLPPVELLVAETTTDATAKIFEAWSAHTGAGLALLDAPLAPLEPRRWFDHVHDDWEQVLGTDRLDLMEAQIRDLVDLVGERTGRRLDLDRLAEVMALANEQAEWNRRTRDLIATTSPAPIGVADAIPATMIPQWHRGSEWGRDAARRLHDEVAARVQAGEGVVPEERARLMWIGRGLWFDMGFYRRFQERHGAVFVWSMYLAVAADAYLRRGGDPLRQLAARFCGFADLYNTPPWSAEWYAKEARHNRIDGVVHLTTDAVRGSHFVTAAVEAAGVPVLEIGGSNVDSRAWDPEEVEAAVDRFVVERVLPRAEDRRRHHKV